MNTSQAYQMTPIKKGQRHAALYDAGEALFVSGVSMKRIELVMRDMNRYRCTPPLNDHQMDRAWIAFEKSMKKKHDEQSR
jgi:hypothetical protein